MCTLTTGTEAFSVEISSWQSCEAGLTIILI